MSQSQLETPASWHSPDLGRVPLGRAKRRRFRPGVALWRLSLIAILAFLVGPLLLLLPMSFSSSAYLVFPPPGFSLQWYERLFESPVWRSATFDSMQIAVATVVLSTALGTLAAFPLVRRSFPFKAAIMIVIASPLVVPEVAIALGLYVVALPLGLTDHWWSVALGQSVLTIPFVTIIVGSALRSFDSAVEDAAASLGAPPWRTLAVVTLPILSPAIFTAMAFTFMFSLNDLLIPLFLGSVDVVPLPVRIWTDLRTRLDLATLALSIIWIGVAALSLLLLRLLQHRYLRPTASRQVESSRRG